MADNNKQASKKLPKKNYALVRDVKIGGKIVKKGTKYPLTLKEAAFFKSKKHIE